MKNYIKKIIIGTLGFAMIFSAQSAFAYIFWTDDVNNLDHNFTYNYNDNCRIVSFDADDTSIEDGDSTMLRWDTYNCDHVKISSIGNVPDSGSKRVYPSYDKTYTLTAYNSNGSHRTESVRIYVDEYNNTSDCYINSFKTSRTNIDYGDAVTLSWNTSHCDSVTISYIGRVSVDGSRTIYPSNDTTYILNAYGDNNRSKSVRIYVDSTSNITTYNTNVVTTVATNITERSAQLNGLITNSDYSSSNVYFNYGTTVSMGNTTTTRTVNNGSNFAEIVSNLSPNTIYFFQAIAGGEGGTSHGTIEVFETLGGTTTTTSVKPTVTQGPTVPSQASPIMLSIENKYKAIGVGDFVDYVVSYKNIGTSKLTNPMIQVYLPKGIVLNNSSEGSYSESDNTLSVPLKDLDPGENGVIYLQGKVKSLEKNVAQIVTTTILVYTNKDEAQENAMAYVLNTPKEQSSLGASAFWAGIYDLGLIGLLLLLILIMILIHIARRILRNTNTKTSRR